MRTASMWKSAFPSAYMANTALVVGGGGFQGLPVLRSLHAIGWQAVVADSVAQSLNRFEADGFHLMPLAKCFEAFRTELLSAIQRHGVKAIFPTTMYDLPPLAKLRPALEKAGIEVYASAEELVALLGDKARTMAAFAADGLPVLGIMHPDHHDFSFPLIGKPRAGWGGQGIVRIATADAWRDFARTHAASDYLWQRELDDFTEWSVDFAIGKTGSLSRMVCRRRIRSTGGFAVISEVADSAPVEYIARQAASWLAGQGGYGIFNIQILEKDGQRWLNDVNPRPGTSSVAALAAGTNLVEFLLDPAAAPEPARPGTLIRTLKDSFIPKRPARIGAVVFDLDETLICQKSWMMDKLELLLADFPVDLGADPLYRFRLEALRVIDEGPWHQLIDIALARSGLPASLSDTLVARWRQLHPAKVAIHQDGLAFIRALQERNIPIALLSDNPAASQRQKISRIPGDISFSSIVLTETLGAPKPDPKGFLHVAQSLDVAPEELLMVGDSPWRDALGALHAGYAGAWIVRRAGSMTNAKRDLFERTFPSLKDRIGWMDSLYGAEHLLEP